MSLMLDSGSQAHACPPWYAPDAPVEYGAGKLLRDVQANPIKYYGSRKVSLDIGSEDPVSGCITFDVPDVHRPVLSLVKAVQQ
eukprot:11802519-Alexandrium_andersonii.AAC.1